MQEQEKDGQEGHFTDSESNELEQDSTERTEGSEGSEGEGSTQTQSGGRGFAGMSEEKRRAIASKGGQSQGKATNPGNFANNREKAAAAGAKGGANSRGGGRTSDTETTESDI